MKRILFLFYLTLLSTCSSIEEKPAVPDSVLTEEKMAAVMVDVHLLEAALNTRAYSKDPVMMSKIHPDSDILKKHGVSKQLYDESFDFYSRNPILLAEVYQLVLNDLSKMQAEVMTAK